VKIWKRTSLRNPRFNTDSRSSRFFYQHDNHIRDAHVLVYEGQRIVTMAQGKMQTGRDESRDAICEVVID
jgi:hypothetical protein